MSQERDGSYWNVNSAGVFRKRYSQEKKTVWSASEVQNQQSVADDTLRAQGNPDTNIAPNGTVPQMVDAKYSKESSNVQEPSGHRTGEEAGSRDIIDMTEEELAEIRAKEREKIDRIFGKEYLDNVAEAVEKRKAERKAVVSKAARELRSELSASPDIVLVSDLKDIPEEGRQGKTAKHRLVGYKGRERSNKGRTNGGTTRIRLLEKRQKIAQPARRKYNRADSRTG